MGGDQRLDLLAHLGVVGRRQRGNEADRHEAVDDDLRRWAHVLVRQPGFHQRAEARVREWLAPVALVEAGGVALVRGDDAGQLGHPVNRFVAHVPDQAQVRAGFEHAVELVQRLAAGEPMERLGADQCIQRGAGQRNRLGRAFQRLHARLAGFQFRPHAVNRLHRDHGGTGLGQQAAEFAGSRTHVRHRTAGYEAYRPGKPVRQCGRVFRPATGISLWFLGVTLLRRDMYFSHDF